MNVPPRRTWITVCGTLLLAFGCLAAIAAPYLAPNPVTAQFTDHVYAPPMKVHVRDGRGFRAPFVYRQVLDDRLTRRYREDVSAPVPLSWFSGGRLLSLPPEEGPLLLLGGDALGRDVLSRLLFGARLSLSVTFVGAAGALVLGALIGGLAGTLGGRTETLLMLMADFVLALPGAYLVLVLRGVLPSVLSVPQIFCLMAVLFSVAGWPHAARGVRAIVSAERSRDYAEAARAAGANSWRLLRHLLPAARGFLGVEVMLLVPALLVAEATISYLGLGFPDRSASWGTLLQDAANVRIMAEAPWLLAPAAGLFLIVLGVQFVGSSGGEVRALLLGTRAAARIVPGQPR